MMLALAGALTVVEGNQSTTLQPKAEAPIDHAAVLEAMVDRFDLGTGLTMENLDIQYLGVLYYADLHGLKTDDHVDRMDQLRAKNYLRLDKESSQAIAAVSME